MNTVRQVKMRLTFQKMVLWFCLLFLLFVGVAFLWEKCICPAYNAWKPLIHFLKEHCINTEPLINLIICFWAEILSFPITFVVDWCLYKFDNIFGKQCLSSLERDKAVFSLSDAPIRTATDDKFGRDAYVRMLRSLILTSPNRSDARYIGVYGQWGDGKTSVWNLLKEHITSDNTKERPTFVEFSLWEYPESADVQMIFFERLSLAVAQNGYGDLSRIASLLAKHFAVSRINRSVGPISDLIDWLRKLLFLTCFSEDTLTESLRSLLRAMTQKVIVVVDDLDRLSKKEICRVIRFIKANGDLPNITYLILADEDHLANAVASLVAQPNKKDIVNGREYLKKIIPLRCPLPAINGSRLLSSFKRHLSVLLTEYGLESENPQDTCDWLLKTYMNNARIGKEILNAFSIKLATYQRHFAGRKYFGVHIGDLLALMIIEIYEPDIYNQIRNMFTKFLQDPWVGDEWDKGISEQWMEEHIFQRACGSRDVIEQFLSERLGISKSRGESPDAKPVVYKLDDPKSPELMLHYRLASQHCFLHYFLLDEDPDQLSQDELEGFLHEIRDEKIPKEQIRKLDESGLLPQLFRALEGQKMLPKKEMSDCYIKTLIFMAGLRFEKYTFSSDHGMGEYQQSIYVEIYRCLLFYCQDIKVHLMNGEKIFGQGIKKVGDILLPVFSEVFDVVLTARLIGNDEMYQKGHIADLSENAFFAPKDYKKLCNMYLERIEHFQREGRLVGHVEFFELFRCWRILLREYEESLLNDRFREACQPMTKDVQAINSMILFFCSDNRNYVNPPCLIVTIRIDDLTEAFGEEGVKAIVSTLNAADKLPEYTCKAWVSLRWELENKKDDESSSEEQKMNRLKELYEKEPYKSEMAAKMLETEPM